MTEQNVGDCAVVLPPKSDKTLRARHLNIVLLRDAYKVDFATPEGFVGKLVFQLFEEKFHVLVVVALFHVVGVFVGNHLEVVLAVVVALQVELVALVEVKAGQILDVVEHLDIFVARRDELMVNFSTIFAVGNAIGGEVQSDDFFNQTIVVVGHY